MTGKFPTARSVKALRKFVNIWRSAGETIALVPTMGALHEGHLSLVRLAKKKAGKVVVSIFVNPAQFAPHEDYDTYPRDAKSDYRKLGELGIDLVFMPDRPIMYPPGFSTEVKVSGLTDCLCGISRPHFFTGVATVVSKLLIQAMPDMAIFGEKDYQQLLVIRRMVKDLDIPTKIMGGPIVREADGLALSSRNAYLSKSQRKTAPILYETLKDTARKLSAGRKAGAVLRSARAQLQSAGFEVDYLEVRHGQTLQELKGIVTAPARIFAAAYLGKTRLIDNVAVKQTK